ncbi:FHA domain protein [Sphingomonas guangdongensis]|uniref:FHA domain protein n=1 Tax=Sphingomonas guangdongensis TaxID=1141890 RepID=A0A285R0N5_9SPHN|nr:type VI secretion system-associated FHA domain protein [Sphingomonas guangdongensis]SOB87665.1 FHA domain protein [Sphingomonas guangdongensis]
MQPIDARLLREGTIKIGRDSAADWSIPDPDYELSRAHCELSIVDGGLSLRALGTNGVFDAGSGERFPDALATPVAVPSTLRFGRFRLRANHAPHGDAPADMARTMVLTPPLGRSAAVPSDWSDAPPAPPPSTTAGTLLDAFCEGAGLDASLLASEEPAEVMRRAGAVYRQMVLGIGDLMTERDRARSQYDLARTTIGGADNNPFKWAPTQRLAVDLLLAGSSTFLSGPAALQASFRDIKRHLIATFAGLQGSLRAAISTFEPADLDKAAAARASLLKSKVAAQAEEVAARHADLTRQLEGEPGSLDRAFTAAYDRAESEIDR